MVDVRLAGKELVHPDRLGAIGATAVERIGGVEFLPQFQQRAIGAGVGDAFLFELLTARDRGGGIATDARLVLFLVFLVEVELARQFNDDLIGLAVGGNDRVD